MSYFSMADWLSQTGDTASNASTAVDAASMAADTAGTASDAGGFAVQAGDAANTSGTAMAEAGAPMQSAYQVNTSAGQSLGDVSGESGFAGWMDRFNKGSEGNLGGFVKDIRAGNYAGAMGYGSNKVMGFASKMGGGGSGGGASPIQINAQQPNPDNSYLARVGARRRMY